MAAVVAGKRILPVSRLFFLRDRRIQTVYYDHMFVSALEVPAAFKTVLEPVNNWRLVLEIRFGNRVWRQLRPWELVCIWTSQTITFREEGGYICREKSQATSSFKKQTANVFTVKCQTFFFYTSLPPSQRATVNIWRAFRNSFPTLYLFLFFFLFVVTQGVK